MKILLLAINARFTHVNLAVYYLRNWLEENNHEVIIIEKNINERVLNILSCIYNYKPDVLCLSCYIWNQPLIKNILEDVKKVLPDLKIVCGGPDIVYNSEHWIANYPSIDCISDDITVAFSKINVTFNNEFPVLPSSPFKKSDRENLQHRYIYYEASRGCPFTCSYCISPALKHPVLYKNFDIIQKELIDILEFEPIIIKFLDRSFNVNKELCINIWNFIKNLNTKTKFHFEIHPLFLNDELLNILESMPEDRIQLEVGIQTIHSDTLKTIGRVGDWEEIKYYLQKLSDLKNIHKHYDMIAGLPDESINHVKKSFEEIISLKPDHFQLGFLKILPGSKISYETEKWGYKFQESAPYSVLSSNVLTFQDMSLIQEVEEALEIVYNSVFFNTFCGFFEEISSFDFFCKLNNTFKMNNISKAVKDKFTLFRIISEFVIDSPFLLDCIIFDWFMLSKTHFYPDFLNAKHCDNFKDYIYLAFKKHKRLFENNFQYKVKNVTFFTCFTELGRILLLNNALGAAHIYNEGIYLIYEDDKKDFKIDKYLVL